MGIDDEGLHQLPGAPSFPLTLHVFSGAILRVDGISTGVQ
jgi:hypothetical protein